MRPKPGDREAFIKRMDAKMEAGRIAYEQSNGNKEELTR